LLHEASGFSGIDASIEKSGGDVVLKTDSFASFSNGVREHNLTGVFLPDLDFAVFSELIVLFDEVLIEDGIVFVEETIECTVLEPEYLVG
jgi:hypothetical protein